jgi:polyvinyl alcohol dehydrogenase (cytochrome)
VSLANGRRAIVAGQKSGVVHALDPDRGGEVLWQERVGKGGINGGVQWGSASDGSNVYVALSDLARFPVPNSQATIPDPEAGGGMFAMSLESGKRVWETPAPRACKNRDRCSPAQSAAVSAIPGVGLLGRDRRSPARLLDDQRIDRLGCRYGSNLQDHQRRPARGGSLNVAGPAISGGTVIINSGYVQNGMPGNALLAYTVDGK